MFGDTEKVWILRIGRVLTTSSETPIIQTTTATSDVHQPSRELGQRREVEIAKQQMVFPQSLQVGLDGLLDLDDHLGFVEELVGARHHGDAHVAEVLIRIAALLTRTVLDEDFMAAAHQLDAGRGNKSDSPLAGFQLTRNANTHGCPVNMSLGRKGGAPA